MKISHIEHLKGCCLPVMCNQKMNSYLKEIADFCGIKKNLTAIYDNRTKITLISLSLSYYSIYLYPS